MQHTESLGKPKFNYLEQYRTTAQAIGLIEMLGNKYPNTRQIRIVEGIIDKLQLTSDACEDPAILIKQLNRKHKF